MVEINNGLNEIQLNKRAISIEDIDQKGLTKRQKVNDQTIFDYMFIKGMIDMSHHEAVHLFIEDMSQSGTSIKSVDLAAFGGSPFHKKGGQIAEKRMIFSDAYRAMHDSADEEDVKSLMNHCHTPYEYYKTGDILEKLSVRLTDCLNALSRHYCCSEKRDPRHILRLQVYGSR